MNGVLLRAKMTRLDSLARRLKRSSPALQGQNVYVLLAIRIHYIKRRVYVAGERPCHLNPRDACEDEDKAEESWG